jgi:hypothetical protein
MCSSIYTIDRRCFLFQVYIAWHVLQSFSSIPFHSRSVESSSFLPYKAIFRVKQANYFIYRRGNAGGINSLKNLTPRNYISDIKNNVIRDLDLMIYNAKKQSTPRCGSGTELS